MTNIQYVAVRDGKCVGNRHGGSILHPHTAGVQVAERARVVEG
ncbi:MAG: hypothetical protein NTY19_36835 [Planctomycetota bacterium]|nr:hypothetical protein [Planctomycetota bacterium]